MNMDALYVKLVTTGIFADIPKNVAGPLFLQRCGVKYCFVALESNSS